MSKEPWSKKKKIIVGCVAAFVVLGIIGSSGSSSNSNSNNSKNEVVSESAAGDTPKEEAAEEIKEADKEEKNNDSLGVGDTGEIGDYKITLNSVNVKDMSGDSYFSSSKPDMNILAVDATVENISDSKELSLSSILMFKVLDKDGRELEMTIWGDNNGNLDGSISPGRKISGEFAVEFPKGANPADYELEFDPTITKGKLYFKLG